MFGLYHLLFCYNHLYCSCFDCHFVVIFIIHTCNPSGAIAYLTCFGLNLETARHFILVYRNVFVERIVVSDPSGQMLLHRCKEQVEFHSSPI